MKRRAKTRLKKHYLIFVAACLIGAFLGGEFSGSLGALTSYSSEDLTPESKAAAPGRSLLQDESLVDLIVDLGEQAEKTPQKNAENENPIFGTSRGVFAYLVDAATSGSFLVTAFSALNSLLGSRSVDFCFSRCFRCRRRVQRPGDDSPCFFDDARPGAHRDVVRRSVGHRQWRPGG